MTVQVKTTPEYKTPISFCRYLVMHGYNLLAAFEMINRLSDTGVLNASLLGMSDTAMLYELKEFGLSVVDYMSINN